jgi:hypothetical protein
MPTASTEVFFVLAVLYAARQHRGNLCCLFVPLASTYVFGASRCLCRPPEKYFSPFYYIIPHSHLLFLYNSHFVYYLYLAKIFAVFLISIFVGQIHMNLLLFVFNC